MPTKDRNWFERKVRELGDVLRRLPRPRQRALFDALDAGKDEPRDEDRSPDGDGDRDADGGPDSDDDRNQDGGTVPDSENSETGDGAKTGDT